MWIGPWSGIVARSAVLIQHNVELVEVYLWHQRIWRHNDVFLWDKGERNRLLKGPELQDSGRDFFFICDWYTVNHNENAVA